MSKSPKTITFELAAYRNIHGIANPKGRPAAVEKQLKAHQSQYDKDNQTLIADDVMSEIL